MSKSDLQVVTHLDSAAKDERMHENKRLCFVLFCFGKKKKKRVSILEFKNQMFKNCSVPTVHNENNQSTLLLGEVGQHFLNENLFSSLKLSTNFQANKNMK